MRVDGQLTTNTATAWYVVTNDAGVHVAAKGTFGAGTLVVQEEVNGTAYTLQNDGTAMSFTASADHTLKLRIGDKIRLSLSGATTPAVDWALVGSVSEVGGA